MCRLSARDPLLISVRPRVPQDAPAAAAQEPEIAFEELHRWLKPGAVVWLTDAQGREIEGKVRDIRPSSLVIEADGTKTFQASDVRQLAERGKRSTKTCLL